MTSLENKLINNFWHLLGHANEIRNNNDFILFKIGSEEIAVVNDNGDIFAFDNLCPHRGTKFLSESSGSKELICPYHGWIYKKGNLYISEKNRFNFSECNKPDLNKYSLEIIGGFIFVSKNPKLKLEVQISGFKERLIEIGDSIAKRIDFDSYHYDCIWQVGIENALEPYHISHVHSDTLASMQLTDGKNHFFDYGSLWRAELGNQKMSKQLDKISRFFDLSNQWKGYEFLYVFPFSMISSTYGYSYSLQNFFPSKEVKTFFSSRLFSTKIKDQKSSQILHSFYESTKKLNRRIFLEDAEICSRISDKWNCKSSQYYANSEEKLMHFRKKIAEFTD